MDAEEMIAEARKAFFVMFGFLALVWALQILNWADGYALSRDYGVLPGNLSRLPDLFSSPFLHWSWAHIESNSGPLFIFGFLAAYRGVKRFLVLSLLVAVTSGLAVWFFQGGTTDTVGASGLIFGYFGYVVVRGLFDRHLIDTLVGIVMAASFAYLVTVAIPGTPGVSWLGHLGGLVGGVAGGWILRDRDRQRGGTPSRPTGGPGSGGGDGPGGGASGGGDGLPARAGEGGSGGSVGSGGSGGSRADLHKELGDLGLL